MELWGPAILKIKQCFESNLFISLFFFLTSKGKNQETEHTRSKAKLQQYKQLNAQNLGFIHDPLAFPTTLDQLSGPTLSSVHSLSSKT